MLAELDEVVWSGLVIGSVECVIVDALCLIILLLLEVVGVPVEESTVAGDMIYRSLTRFPVTVIDGDGMAPLPRPNTDVYLPVSNW